MTALFRCPSCGRAADAFGSNLVCVCGDLFDVEHDAAPPADLARVFDERANQVLRGASGVWRYKELIYPGLPEDGVVHLSEGNTPLLESDAVAQYCGASNLLLKHEGLNPTGSFKDRGMTVAVSHVRQTKVRAAVCASTGNTAASLAAYCARAGLRAAILVPDGFTALGKLSQAMAYGARTLVLRGSFDDAMQIVQDLARDGEVALLNSIFPFRVEGQKAILFEIFQQLDWVAPDWFVFPAGNLGNCAAFGRALADARRTGLIRGDVRFAAIQASGAAPFHAAFERGFDELKPVVADTLASAIRIGAPVSYRRAIRSLEATNGIVAAVTDAELLAAKVHVDGAGIGAEPASCVSVAGVRQLVERGLIARGARVVALLTGHVLKDADTTLALHRGELGNLPQAEPNPPRPVVAELDAVRAQLLAD